VRSRLPPVLLHTPAGGLSDEDVQLATERVRPPVAKGLQERAVDVDENAVALQEDHGLAERLNAAQNSDLQPSTERAAFIGPLT